jgi:N-acyl-D-amino-acid deacylase
LIRNVVVFDGSGGQPRSASVAIAGARIAGIGELDDYAAATVLDGQGNALAPGFIDAHTHDDLCVIGSPQMLPKLSQGVTTVVVGNCGVSAAPVSLPGRLPDPMNLLGEASQFCYPTFAAYVAAVQTARPAVNVAAFVGHTALRNNHMDRLDRTATGTEVEGMRAQLRESLDHGALGLSTGLAYLSAYSASSEEVKRLAEPLAEAGALYAAHLRSEAASVLEAMEEAFEIARHAQIPLVISHLKCAGIDNWGRADEVLRSLESAAKAQSVGCDCYPYAASASTLDLRQVDPRLTIMITWSDPHPEMAGKTMADIALLWGQNQIEAAQRLQPAGAIYHAMSEDDMRTILQHPATMIGSDGLPNDPLPHPRLWGTFPRVLGYYSRQQGLFSLADAVRKMTALPAQRFSLRERGLIHEGYRADLVLFNPRTVQDRATFADPVRAAEGIEAVWVNGILSYRNQYPTGQRAGRFLPRQTAVQVC